MAVRGLLAALLLAGCSYFATGITRERAIEIALQGGSPLMQPITVTGVREGRVRDLRNDPNSGPGPGELDRMVWEVTLQGRQSICPPFPGGACVVAQATTRVYLDHATGEFVFSETTAQPGPFAN